MTLFYFQRYQIRIQYCGLLVNVRFFGLVLIEEYQFEYYIPSIEIRIWHIMTLTDSTFSSLTLSYKRIVKIPVHSLLHEEFEFYIKSHTFLCWKLWLWLQRGVMEESSYSLCNNVHDPNTSFGVRTILYYLQLSDSVHILSISIHQKQS